MSAAGPGFKVKSIYHDAGIEMSMETIEDSERARFVFNFPPERPFVGRVEIKTDDPYVIEAKWQKGYEPPVVEDESFE